MWLSSILLSNPLIPQISQPEECGYSTLDSSNPDFASRVSTAPNIGCTCILSTPSFINIVLRCLYHKRGDCFKPYRALFNLHTLCKLLLLLLLLSYCYCYNNLTYRYFSIYFSIY